MTDLHYSAKQQRRDRENAQAFRRALWANGQPRVMEFTEAGALVPVEPDPLADLRPSLAELSQRSRDELQRVLERSGGVAVAAFNSSI